MPGLCSAAHTLYHAGEDYLAVTHAIHNVERDARQAPAYLSKVTSSYAEVTELVHSENRSGCVVDLLLIVLECVARIACL